MPSPYFLYLQGQQGRYRGLAPWATPKPHCLLLATSLPSEGTANPPFRPSGWGSSPATLWKRLG